MTVRGSIPGRMVFSLPLTGLNGGAVFNDAKGRTVTRVGSVVTTTAQSTAGLDSSASFPGGANYLSLAANADYDFGAGPFRLRAFVRPANVSGIKIICTNRASTGSDPGFIFFLTGAQAQFLCYGPSPGAILANITTPGTPFAANTWAEVDVWRIPGPSTSTWQIKVNGTTLISTTTANSAIAASGNPLYIGRDPSVAGREFSGFMLLAQGFKGGHT